jgi:hypothetical protein
MANDYTAKDVSGTTQTFKATDNGSNKTPHVNVDVIPAGTNRIGKFTMRNAANAADIDPLAEDTFTRSIGEIEADPSDFTVLARLKSLITDIVLAAGSNIVGSVRDAGPHYTPTPIHLVATDATDALDLTGSVVDQMTVIDDLVISVEADTEVQIIEEDSLTIIAAFFLSASSPLPLINIKNGIRAEIAGKKLLVKTLAHDPAALRAVGSYHSE